MDKVFQLLLGIVAEIKLIGLEYSTKTLAPDRRPIHIGDLCDLLQDYYFCIMQTTLKFSKKINF